MQPGFYDSMQVKWKSLNSKSLHFAIKEFDSGNLILWDFFFL